MSLDVATLGIRVDASGAITVLDQLGNKLAVAKNQASALDSTLTKLIAAFGAYKAAEWAKETLLLGARYETMGVVIETLGRTAGKSFAQMATYQAALQQTGISAIGARESLAKMAGAQLDLAKSSQLARVAQDAAVIANTNSSEAFGRLIDGITTGQPRILRTLGIFVDMDAGQQKFAASLGKTVEQLTEVERTQANMNTALQGGVAIAGTYEAAMGTAGKQLQSTVRYMEDMRVKASLAFQPQFTEAVFAYARALKWIGDNAHVVTGAMVGLAAALGGVAVAMKGAAILTFLANPVSAAVIAAIGLLAVEFGSAAANAALAARETREYYETLKVMSDTSLRNKLQDIKDAMRNGVDAKTYLELQKKQDDIEAELTRRAKETTKAKQDQKVVVDELLVAAQKELADATKKLAFDNTHIDLLLKIAQAKKEQGELDEWINKKLERRAVLLGVLAGGSIPLSGGVTMPKTGTSYEWETRFGLSTIGGASVGSGIPGTPLPAAVKAAETEIAQIRAQVYENFLRGLQERFAATFENIFTHGLRGFKDLFSSVGTLIAQTASQLAASGLMTWMKGKYNDAGGGMAGVGAVVGAIPAVGWIAAAGVSLLAMGQSAKQASEDVKRMGQALDLTFAQLRAEVGDISQEQLRLTQEREKYNQARQQVIDKAQREMDSVSGNPLTTRWHKDKRFDEINAAAQAEINKLNALEEKRIALLAKEAEELKAWQEARTASSLRERELRARGFTAEADALALWNRQVEEFQAAVKAGWSTDMLAYLATVQELERNQAAQARTAAEAAEAARVLADQQAELARVQEAMAQRIADAQQRAADTIAKYADAGEDLSVRMLKATGQMAEADRKAFELQQKREQQAVQRELQSLQLDAMAIQRKRSPLGVESLPGGYAAPIWGTDPVLGYLGSTQAQAVLTAEYQSVQDQMKAIADYLAQLQGVQAAEALAFTNGQSMPGASSALPGTAGSFNTIVSRATSAQGDRMVDELTTARTIQQTYLPYLKTIAERLSGGVNALLGNALQNDLSLAGSALVA